MSQYCPEHGGHHFLTLGHIASYSHGSHALKDCETLPNHCLNIPPDTMNGIVSSGMHFPAMQPDLPASSDHRKLNMLGHVEDFYLMKWERNSSAEAFKDRPLLPRPEE